MHEQRLIELLQLIDEPIDEPIDTDFKRQLRHELNKTLHHESTKPEPQHIVALAPLAARRTRHRRLRLLAVAAVTVTVIAGLAVITTRRNPGQSPADQPAPPTTTSTPTTTMAVLPDADAACARYAGVAEPLAVLTSFARSQSAPIPDLAATEIALRQLVLDATAGEFLSADVIDSLELAAGALAEARREAETGDLASASSATQLAVLNLTEQVQSASLASCLP